MKPFLDPAKRHKKVRTSAAALSTTGMRAEKRMVCDVLEKVWYDPRKDHEMYRASNAYTRATVSRKGKYNKQGRESILSAKV